MSAEITPNAPLELRDLPRREQIGIEAVIRKVVRTAAFRGGGHDFLARIYMAGVYHGATLAREDQ